MKNDPTKWTQQTWLIPGEAFLKRDGEKWALSVYDGLHVALDAELAERLVEHLTRNEGPDECPPGYHDVPVFGMPGIVTRVKDE